MSIFRKKCNKSSSEEESFIATCSCVGGDSELDHSISFSLYNYKGTPELYIHTWLVSHKSFWKRIELGVKYILNIPCRYGLWGEWIGDHETVTAIRNICNNYLKMEKNKEVTNKVCE